MKKFLVSKVALLSCLLSFNVAAKELSANAKVILSEGVTITLEVGSVLEVSTCDMNTKNGKLQEICTKRKTYLTKKENDALTKALLSFIDLSMELDDPDVNKKPTVPSKKGTL